MQRLFYGGTNMYLGVDLGSTNIKAAIYDGSMRLVGQQSRPVEYLRENGFVEFDAERYYNELAALIAQLTRDCGVSKIRQIAFTGQAESLVCVDAEGRACMHAISWMDERSTEECKLLAAQFDAALCERVTGQQALLPTWPATKILWLKKNRPDVFAAAETFMLLKDYIVFRLTGRKLADMSIATFTFYFDIYEKHYWTQMLDAIGIDETRLPPLVEPCSVAGPLTASAAQALGLTQDTLVNVGTLDHFAGMIGTGNVRPGGVTLSTGTVMALAVMAQEPAPRDSGIAMHYGFLPDTHVMLPVAESGGVSLEWFRRTCMPETGYDEMNRVLLARGGENPLIFLPYLVGTNAPEFDADAAGMFLTWRTPSWRALRSCCAKTATPSPQRERSPTTSSPPEAARKAPSGASCRRTSPACRSSCRGKRKPPASARPSSPPSQTDSMRTMRRPRRTASLWSPATSRTRAPSWKQNTAASRCSIRPVSRRPASEPPPLHPAANFKHTPDAPIRRVRWPSS